MNSQYSEITVHNAPYYYHNTTPLLSIHLASNRPIQFTEFVENIHASCSNKNAYEIVVKIDTEDTKMIQCVNDLVRKYGVTKVKPFISPRKDGPWSTWEAYNDMFHMTHPDCYFLWNPSDEVRIDTPNWDKVLEKYIGFFPDHVFRLKLSDNRLRNFYHLREVLGNPDNFPFMTKKWMDICGLWGDCHSPDLFHQAVSYYLGKKNIFRDIPIFDIQLSGIEAGLLILPKKIRARTLNIYRLWRRALSGKIRNRYLTHAEKIKFYLDSCQEKASEINYQELLKTNQLICQNNLGTLEKKYCRDKVFLTDQAILYMRSALMKLRFFYRSIIETINWPVKKLFRWDSFYLISAENKQLQLNEIKSNAIHLHGLQYLLIKQPMRWELLCHSPSQSPLYISIEKVLGLEQALNNLSTHKAPEMLTRKEIKNVKKALVSYHFKCFIRQKTAKGIT